MKRKYYLRGLGIGILVTALVFIIAGPSELSDEEIIKRAEKLGYTKVEATPSIGIKDLLETPVPTLTGNPTPETSGTPVPTKVPETTPEPTEGVVSTPVPTPEPTIIPEATPVPTPIEIPTVAPTNTPAPTKTPTPEPTVTSVPTSAAGVVTAVISVERGNTATMVCDKIEAAGILKDGKKLRNYLIDNSLTDYINIGKYTLSSDMSLEEMADILTGR